MKRNNNSTDIRDWTTKKLKDEARGYHQSIYVSECYGSSDLHMYDAILSELDNRDIAMHTELSFN